MSLASFIGACFFYGIWWESSQSIGTNWMSDTVEQLSVTHFEFSSNNSAVVTIRNSGSYTATLVSAKTNEQAATLDPTGMQTDSIPKGTSVNVTLTSKAETPFGSGETIQFKLYTAKGNVIQYTATYNPTA
jgi:P pilus assembly chaperone PapD